MKPSSKIERTEQFQVSKELLNIKEKVFSLENVINGLTEQLNSATIKFASAIEDNGKTYKVTIEDLTKKVTLANQQCKIKDEQLKLAEKKIAELNKKIETVKKNATETVSFKLGHVLIHCTQSWKNFLSLPIDLWKIRQFSKDKKLLKQNKEYMASVKSKTTSINVVDGKLKKQYGLKFISILDEISNLSFSSEFRLFPLNKNSYVKQIEGSTSLGLLLESCWKGNGGAWEYAFTSPNLQHQNAQNLINAIEVSKKRNLPVIFWNKEDPMHYEKFLPIASLCDVIFTTDSNKLLDYKRDIPSAKVEVMPFAANINYCNPKDRFRNEQEDICFAGSYYGQGHDNRKRQMDALLPTIISFKGAIYDRMSQLNQDRYAYPRKYRQYIRPAVPFKDIIDVYKRFKIFLNVNTITDSPTMMSRRVYELLACGTPVISTPSLAIDEQFKGIVQIAKNAKEANKIAKRLLENEWEWARLSHLGYREVMLNHTYEHRAIQIANVLGQDIHPEKPVVSIIMASTRPKFISRIVENLTRQVYPRIEVVIIAQKYSDAEINELEEKLKNAEKKFEDIAIVRNDSEDTLGSRLNQAISLSKGEYVAKFDDDDYYFPNYLQDMLIPFKFGDYGVVGKKEIFIYLENQDKTYVRFKGQRHLETNFLTGATLVFSRKALAKIKFGDLNKGEDSNILEQANRNGIKMYVADPFNFIVYRAKDITNHTWQVNDDFFTEKGVFVGDSLALDIVEI